MAREADVARGTLADATQHARPCGRAARARVGPRWRGHVAGATRVHVGARVVPCGRVGTGIWRAHGLVGPR